MAKVYADLIRKGLKTLDTKKEEWGVFTEQVNAVIHGASLA